MYPLPFFFGRWKYGVIWIGEKYRDSDSVSRHWIRPPVSSSSPPLPPPSESSSLSAIFNNSSTNSPPTDTSSPAPAASVSDTIRSAAPRRLKCCCNHHAQASVCSHAYSDSNSSHSQCWTAATDNSPL